MAMRMIKKDKLKLITKKVETKLKNIFNFLAE